MNKLTIMNRMQDVWRHAVTVKLVSEVALTCRKYSLPRRNETLKRWQLVLVAVGILTFPLTAQSEIPSTNTMKASGGAGFAVCGHPDERGRLYVKLNGHEFWVHRATVVRDFAGKAAFVGGQISHKLAWRPDDQIYYQIPFQDGKAAMPMISIDHGGVSAFFEILPLEIIDSLKMKIGGVEFGLDPDKIPEAVGEIGRIVEGRGWEGQAAALVAVTSLVATSPNYCEQFHWTEWVSEETNVTPEGWWPGWCGEHEGTSGFACQGDYCDNVKLACARVPERTSLNYSTTYWSPYFSEEGASSGQNTQYCNGIVTGIHCTGRYCDNISLECTQPATGTLTNCQWSESLSEENGGVDNFGKGNFITAVECRGRYCDNLRFRVCSLMP